MQIARTQLSTLKNELQMPAPDSLPSRTNLKPSPPDAHLPQMHISSNSYTKLCSSVYIPPSNQAPNTHRNPLKNLPDDTIIESSLFEAPRNLGLNADGVAGRFEGFFRPPVSSNYTFISAADDWSMVWIGRNGSNPNLRELIIDTSNSGFVASRDWWVHVFHFFCQQKCR
jgi:hypothetical protein